MLPSFHQRGEVKHGWQGSFIAPEFSDGCGGVELACDFLNASSQTAFERTGDTELETTSWVNQNHF